MNSEDYEDFRDALAKLTLNDASLFYEPETSDALGFGFRCGFLGTLHMEIIQERLEREYDLDLITTAPTVIYEVLTHARRDRHGRQPLAAARSRAWSRRCASPSCARTSWCRRTTSARRSTSASRSAACRRTCSSSAARSRSRWELPLSEVVLDFFDRLKSLTRGYGSLDYSFERFQAANLVRLDVLINGDRVDALAIIVHRDQAQSRGRVLVEKMRELIPRQMFDVAIQAAIGGHIIARQTVKALRKNVIAKCYGGDVTRKKKLLEKQKEGKKRMKQVGRVEIPQAAFLAVLKVDS